MRSALIRKIGGIVGLLAILMSTLAPAASQMLERGRIEAMLATFCTADTGGQNRYVEQQSKKAPALGHLQACDYCNLAAHTPLLPPPAAASLAATPAESQPAADRRAIAPPYAPVVAAQPRAPPFPA